MFLNFDAACHKSAGWSSPDLLGSEFSTLSCCFLDRVRERTREGERVMQWCMLKSISLCYNLGTDCKLQF